jgi:subtilisin family serine protease
LSSFVLGALRIAGDAPDAAAAAPGSPGAIHLKARTIEPAHDPAHDLAVRERVARAVRAHAARGRVAHVVVQLAALPDAPGRSALARAGLELHGHVPDRAFVAALHSGADAAALATLGVIRIEALTAADKMAPALRRGALPAHVRLEDDRVALVVEFHADVPLDAALPAVLAATGADQRGEMGVLNAALLAVPAPAIPALAAREEVKWIEPASPRLEDLNAGVRLAVGADSAAAPPLDLRGSGVTVLVFDGGIVCPTQPDLSPRVVVGESGLQSTHSTHVAGTFGGSGAASGGLHRGVAPGATIVSYMYDGCSPVCLYNNPRDIEADYRAAITLHGADFATNSLGANIMANGYDCDLLGDYENTARLIDAIAAGALGVPFLSFWAAGNERQGQAYCGDGYYSLGVPAAAKNAIVVGAIYSDTFEIASFSSLGPADDGRMKPDLVAPGCEVGGDHGVTSTRSCTGTAVYCGTSMATPAAAGVAALVHERLASSPRGPVTLPATTKAILAASARDLGLSGPDYTYGYGLVDAVAAVGIVDSGTIVEAEIAPGTVLRRSLAVPAGRARLRVVLAWDDPPGEPLALSSLINDLDLRLIDPAGSVVLPFVLDPLFPEDPAGRGRNPRDSSELVEVANPLPGRWLVEVTGEVASGGQTLALVADAADGGPVAVGESAVAGAGARSLLAQNAPNPFNPVTAIRFTVPGSGSTPVTLAIFDLHGRRVRTLVDAPCAAGTHTAIWDGRNEQGRPAASGVYAYELIVAGRREARRMVLVK